MSIKFIVLSFEFFQTVNINMKYLIMIFITIIALNYISIPYQLWYKISLKKLITLFKIV